MDYNEKDFNESVSSDEEHDNVKPNGELKNNGGSQLDLESNKESI